jgi:hypothetical protein
MGHEFYEFSRRAIETFVKIRKIRVPFLSTTQKGCAVTFLSLSYQKNEFLNRLKSMNYGKV